MSSDIATTQLAEVLRVLGLLGLQLKTGQLCDAIDQASDLGTEQAFNVRECRIGILDGVVQQSRDDRLMIELELGQNPGDFNRVTEVGIARGPCLTAMHLHGIDIGSVERFFVGRGIVVS